MKKKLISIGLVLGLIMSVGFAAAGCGGNQVTLADLEGQWTLQRFHISGSTMTTFFTSITFDDEGNFTAGATGGGTITGHITLANNGRIRFNSNSSAVNDWFNRYQYRVRFSGSGMTWDWFSAGRRQNTQFVWNAAN